MFGLFMLILFIFAVVASYTKRKIEVNKRKQDAIKERKDFYLDEKYRMTHIDTDEPYTYMWINGDYYEVNAITCKPTKNLSAESRKKSEEEGLRWAIENNERFYPFEPKRGSAHHDCHKRDKCIGIRYKDRETGEIYVKRKNFNHVYYMNVKNGRLEHIVINEPGFNPDVEQYWGTHDYKRVKSKYKPELAQTEMERWNKDANEEFKKNGRINYMNHKRTFEV